MAFMAALAAEEAAAASTPQPTHQPKLHIAAFLLPANQQPSSRQLAVQPLGAPTSSEGLSQGQQPGSGGWGAGAGRGSATPCQQGRGQGQARRLDLAFEGLGC
jgi:hypothetical protein